MKKVLRCVAAVCLLITTISVSDKLVAQTVPTVDIGLFASNDTLEVRVIADANFNEVVSNLVFTIRWDTASAVSYTHLRAHETR